MSAAILVLASAASWAAGVPSKPELLGEMAAWRATQLPDVRPPDPITAAFEPRLKRLESRVEAASSEKALAAAGEGFEQWKKALLSRKYAASRAAGVRESFADYAKSANMQARFAAALRLQFAQRLAAKVFQQVQGRSAAAVSRPGSFFDGRSRAGDVSEDVSVVSEPAPLDPRDPARYRKVRQILISQGRPAGIVDMIIHEAIRQNADPVLILSVVNQESQFNARATSFKRDRHGRLVRDSRGRAIPIARGLMQLTADKGQNLYDPRTNVRLGIRYLKSLWSRFVDIDMAALSRINPFSRGDVKLAIAAYNAGPTAVAKYGAVPPYRETQDYVEKVLGYYSQFKRYLTRSA